MTTSTANYGWVMPDDGGDPDTWGAILNTLFGAQDASLKTVETLAQYAGPTGMVADFLMTAEPAGWTALDGKTIGNAGSGAGRANADSEALFMLLWGQFGNTIMPVLNSDGTAGTRGASAAADWAALKQLTLIDQRDQFRRSYKAGGSSAAIGVAQLDSLKSHTHGYTLPKSGSGANTPIISDGENSSQEAHTTSDASTGTATETRPVNISYLTCIKL